MKVHEEYFEFLRSVSSLYEALTHSAVDPVVLSEPETGAQMYYDAFGDGGDEDVAIAELVMKKRIAYCFSDIERHDFYHKQFVRLFYDIDEFLNTRSFNLFASRIKELCGLVWEYSEDIIHPHQEKKWDGHFLQYPSCLRQYAFHIPQSRLVGHLVFNETHDKEGLEKNLEDIFAYANEIRDSLILPPIKIATQEDHGEGFMDCSLRGRYELNKKLLKL